MHFLKKAFLTSRTFKFIDKPAAYVQQTYGNCRSKRHRYGLCAERKQPEKVYIDKIGIYLSECLDEYCSDI